MAKERISEPEDKSVEASRRRRKRKGRSGIFEVIMSKYFAKLMTDTKPQVQKAQRISRLNT